MIPFHSKPTNSHGLSFDGLNTNILYLVIIVYVRMMLAEKEGPKTDTGQSLIDEDVSLCAVSFLLRPF